MDDIPVLRGHEETAERRDDADQVQAPLALRQADAGSDMLTLTVVEGGGGAVRCADGQSTATGTSGHPAAAAARRTHRLLWPGSGT